MKGLESGIEILSWPPGANIDGYKDVRLAVYGKPVSFSFPVEHLERFKTEEELGQWLSRAAKTTFDWDRDHQTDEALAQGLVN
jgi:hypothetical protein